MGDLDLASEVKRGKASGQALLLSPAVTVGENEKMFDDCQNSFCS